MAIGELLDSLYAQVPTPGAELMLRPPSMSGNLPYQNTINQAAMQNMIDPALFSELIRKESMGHVNAMSPAGAIGLTQLMPPTAKSLGVNPYDPYENIHGGAKYLMNLLDQFGGDPKLALAAYNAGPGAVKQAMGVPNIPETKNYVNDILSMLGVQQ